MPATIHLLLISIEAITCGKHQNPAKRKAIRPNEEIALAHVRSFDETIGVQPASLTSSASLGGIGPRINRIWIRTDNVRHSPCPRHGATALCWRTIFYQIRCMVRKKFRSSSSIYGLPRLNCCKRLLKIPIASKYRKQTCRDESL